MNSTLARDSYDSHPPRMSIIQCPSCRTKFAIESEVVEAVLDPRFHCSRCDEVFSLEDNNAGLDQGKPKITKVTDSSSQSESELCVKEDLADDYSSNHPIKINEIDEPVINESPWKSSFEIPKYQQDYTKEAPHEEIVSDHSQFEFSFQPRDLSDDELSVERLKSFSIPQEYPSSGIKGHYSPTSEEPLDDTYKLGDLSDSDVFNFTEEKPKQTSIDDFQKPYKQSYWSGFRIITAPILFFLALLGGLSVYFEFNPELEKSVSAHLSSPSLIAAPNGLFVSEVKFMNVPLENGETVYTLTGKLVNQSNESLKDAMLQGVLFNKAGEVIEEKRVRASSMSDVRIRSLTSDKIQEIQQREMPTTHELNSGSEMDFQIVFISRNAEETTHFSTKVFSVFPK